MGDKTPISLSQKSRRLLFLPTPETVKARGLIALRRQQMATIARRNGGFSIPEFRHSHTLKDRSSNCAVRKEKKKVVKVPWLGVGFQSLEAVSTSRTAIPDVSKETTAQQVSMDSKDVQVSIALDSSSSRTLMPLKKVQVGDGIPTEGMKSTTHFDYQQFFEIRKRAKRTQREQLQEETKKVEASQSANVTFTAPNVSTSQDPGEKLVAPQVVKPVLRKTLTRVVPCVVPANTYKMRINSVPRAKTSFSVSRIRRQTGNRVQRQREDQPSLPFPASFDPSLPCPSTSHPSRSHSFPLFDLRAKQSLPPHRIPVEFHLFRRVKKSSLTKLRSGL